MTFFFVLDVFHLPSTLIWVSIVAPPGTRLAREWAGRTHEVVVIESGVVYKSKAWDSLSEVARHITGKRRNGPRCFGLRHPWTMIAATS